MSTMVVVILIAALLGDHAWAHWGDHLWSRSDPHTSTSGGGGRRKGERGERTRMMRQSSWHLSDDATMRRRWRWSVVFEKIEGDKRREGEERIRENWEHEEKIREGESSVYIWFQLLVACNTWAHHYPCLALSCNFCIRPPVELNFLSR
jgi:hypothetical protein